MQCLNCNFKLESHFQYCPQCGQKSEEKLSIKVLFYNTIANYFSVDARFFKSFVPLLFKPGYLPLRFIEGKRLLYLHPAQMYLFVSIIFFFIFSFSVSNQVQIANKSTQAAIGSEGSINREKMDPINTENLTSELEKSGVDLDSGAIEIAQVDSLINKAKKKDNRGFVINGIHFNSKKIDSLIALQKTDAEILSHLGIPANESYFKKKLFKQYLKFYRNKDGGTILQKFYDSIPIVLFFLLPLFAFILKLLYFKKAHYVYHLVFSFYYFAFVFVVLSLFTFLNLNWVVYDIVNAVLIVSLFLYLLLAMKRFYKQKLLLTLFKFFTLSVTFLLFVIPMTVVFLMLYAFMFY